MENYTLGAVETRFADIIWDNAPLTTNELIALCDQKDGKLVSVKIPRERFYSMQSENYVERAFNGSLPKFLAAFTSERRLSREEAEELKRLIDSASED